MVQSDLGGEGAERKRKSIGEDSVSQAGTFDNDDSDVEPGCAETLEQRWIR